MTKFRIGAALGFATGYYLGAKAGRERYVQLQRLVQRAQRETAIGTVVGKAKAVVDLGRERAHSHDTHAFGEPVVDLTTNDPSIHSSLR